LSDYSGRAPTTRDPHGRESRSAQTWQFMHYGCDRPRVRFVKINMNGRNESAHFLLRVYPLVGARHLYRHARVSEM
jgi:hypothetical protein